MGKGRGRGLRESCRFWGGDNCSLAWAGHNAAMRIIKPARLREFAATFPQAASALERWLKLVESANWASLVDIRRVFRSADEVKVASGRVVVIFNIKGNDLRLITAIHYNRRKVFVMLLLTHAEYSRNRWKEIL